MNYALQIFNHELNLACILTTRAIDPAPITDIKVIDAEIIKPQSNVERFYEWLQRCGNIHLYDNNQVNNAFQKIPTYE